MTIYCIDTSALLDLRYRIYPPDVFPSLWEQIDTLCETGRLIAPVDVREELARRDNEAYRWAKERPSMFVELDEKIQAAVSEIMEKCAGIVDERRGTSRADPFIVAVARVREATVVTSETPRSTANARPKIPDACGVFGVPCVRVLPFLRAEGWRF